MSKNLFDQYDINAVLKVIHILETHISELPEPELPADDVFTLVGRSYTRGLKAGYEDALRIIRTTFYMTEPHKSEYIPYNEPEHIEKESKGTM